MTNTTWLNIIHTFICTDCKYECIAPKYGNCPKCKSERTVLKDDSNPHYGPVRL